MKNTTNPRAVVTGIGVISSNAHSREDFFHSIMNGESGLRTNERLVQLGAMSSVAGQIEMDYAEMSNPEDDEKANYLAYIAIEEALRDSGMTKEAISHMGVRAGLSLSTSLAGNEKLTRYVNMKQKECDISPEWIIDFTSYTMQIAKFTGIRGPAFTTVSACSAGTAGAGIAKDLICDGVADLVIVIGTDTLLDIPIAGFHSLNSMSINGCRPFDKNRDGMTIGEGAAAFVVQSLDRALSQGCHIYGEILGYGLGNDAYHITSPDPDGEGAYRTMQMALQDAGLEANCIDYINAHGTATELNDLMEANAITKLYGSQNKEQNVCISSTKSVTGHCLGAAGSVELAVALLSVDRDVVPPTAFLQEPSDEFVGLNLVQGERVKKEVKYAMSNSFAFSGNSASIIVGKVTEPKNSNNL
ncbi:beta-ketoacyl-[acyl-carrier-protein] synthase family protein [Paenibacillus alvei]|uniref:beta-ketoacyl-[acyl-carrier-protein] synthase family protein n=1 Tax=Paenibacillus alvei TaxID=44250 RepID=UPI0003860438|nr:beta-ketoacyl-[acyl-carrier-protein] synthase family protein [Paenibacillus alvei]EPY14034.1 3-oxoacyl-(acyl-carrier-protein) synthase [Paenibacillus alvei A6-6i-x]